MKKNYEDLKVWQESINLVDSIYNLTKNFPKDEVYGLVSQLRRCAISVPSNIAEGAERSGKKEFLRFLDISAGSLAELKTQIIISSRNNLLENKDFEVIYKNIEEVSKMLNGLRKSLKPTT